MKNIVFAIALLVSGALSAQKWESSLVQATESAKKTNRNIILVFSGSDWCAPCIKLDKAIWQSPEFQSFAKENWVLLKADFPRKKDNKLTGEQQERNAQLANMYNKNGYFPLVVVLDPNGNMLGQTGYKDISPKEYVELLKGFKG